VDSGDRESGKKEKQGDGEQQTERTERCDLTADVERELENRVALG
jgi:hypothetical protein